jgi:PAS domain S-box-containing protein
LAVIIYIVQYQTNSIIEELTVERAQAANLSLKNYLAELEGRAVLQAEIISHNDTVITAVKNKDYESLKRLLSISITDIDFASICDSNGIVLVRSHSDITGDDISVYRSISTALRTGGIISSLEPVESNGGILSIFASVPIYDNRNLIGVVNCNYDLSKNEYVDEFKELTGCEASIIQNNYRISTTLRDETGERVTGTSVYDFIYETVFTQRKDYFGNLNLFGRMYGIYFTPLIKNDEIIGILSTGVDIEHIFYVRRTMNSWIIRTSVTGILISVAFVLISGGLMGRYARHTDKQFNQQMLMTNISRSFLADVDINILITEILHIVGEFMNVPQVLLFKREENTNNLICSNEWINPKTGLASRLNTKLFFNDQMFAFVNSFKPGSGRESCLTSNDPFVSEKMTPFRVSFKNYISAPVYINGELTGIIDFSNNEEHEWNESEKSLATFLASALSGVFEREAMERRTSIVENSPYMIYYVNPEGQLGYANPAAVETTGFTIDELKNGGLDILFNKETIRNINEIYIPNTLRNGVDRHEIVMTCKDGRKRILEMTSFVLKDDNIATISVDLTEIRTLQSELINAKNNAEQSNLAKSGFLSNMSHEMRTPMNAIIGMTAIARAANDIERKNYSLSRIEESSRHLLGIINDVLDMSKIEANKFQLTNIRFDLKKLVQKAVSIVNLSMEAKRQRFSMRMDEEMPAFFLGDDQRLTQVLMNLLSNAVKFTPEEGEISLSVFFMSDQTFIEGNMVYEIIFEVSDTGIGIPPGKRKKIFNMFEQAEKGTTRKCGGTGLGLSISKRIVELMGGKIYVESETGKGSNFIFSVKMPGIKTENNPDNTDKDYDYLSGKKENLFAGKKLLFAEDIEINREILIAILDGTGIIVETAENGMEALKKYMAAPASFDLVLMDIRMPEMDGIEATQHIREFEGEYRMLHSEENLKNVPIIAMTANVFKDDIDNCINAGMDDHIGKPLEVNVVFEKLGKYLFTQHLT